MLEEYFGWFTRIVWLVSVSSVEHFLMNLKATAISMSQKLAKTRNFYTLEKKIHQCKNYLSARSKPTTL